MGACDRIWAWLKPMKFTAPNQIDEKAGLEIDWPKNRLIGSAPTMHLNRDHVVAAKYKNIKVFGNVEKCVPHR